MYLSFHTLCCMWRWRSSRPKWPEQRECPEPAGQDGDLPHPNQQVWAPGRRWQRLEDSNDKVSLLLEDACVPMSQIDVAIIWILTVWECWAMQPLSSLWCIFKPITPNHTYSELLNIEFGIAMNVVWLYLTSLDTACVSLLLSLSSTSLLSFLLLYNFLS